MLSCLCQFGPHLYPIFWSPFFRIALPSPLPSFLAPTPAFFPLFPLPFPLPFPLYISSPPPPPSLQFWVNFTARCGCYSQLCDAMYNVPLTLSFSLSPPSGHTLALSVSLGRHMPHDGDNQATAATTTTKQQQQLGRGLCSGGCYALLDIQVRLAIHNYVMLM